MIAKLTRVFVRQALQQLKEYEIMPVSGTSEEVQNRGYDVTFIYKDRFVRLPITPSAISISIEGNNDEISLIDGTNINLLRSPKLMEISFDAMFPEWELPFSYSDSKYQKMPYDFEWYYTFFSGLMSEKCMARFIVTRPNPPYIGKERQQWDTNLLVTIEEMNIKQDVESYGITPCISFKLKQARPYGVRVITTNDPDVQKRETENAPSPEKNEVVKYKVVSGDDLAIIAKRFYGNTAFKDVIYYANQELIENTAKKYKHESSENGHWIFPDMELVIPYISQEGVVDDDLLASSLQIYAEDGILNDEDVWWSPTDPGEEIPQDGVVND